MNANVGDTLCTGSGLGISLFTSIQDVHVADTLFYSVNVFNEAVASGRTACDATGIQAFIVTPDGKTNVVTLVRTTLHQGESDFYPGVVSYVVRAQDIHADGTLLATAREIGIIHQDDTDKAFIQEAEKRTILSPSEFFAHHSLRPQIDEYFRSVLPRRATEKQEREAIEKTLRRFHEPIDYYIRYKEEHGDEAIERSAEKVREVDNRFVQNICYLVGLVSKHIDFYTTPSTTFEEARRKIEFLKHVIENQDGYKLFYVKGQPVERERDLQILFKLVWEGSPSSVDAEVNNGRGPVDFKVSRGANDQTLVEFKLASNPQIERNIENQVAIYEKANNTTQSYKVIVFFASQDQAKVQRILERLKVPQAAGIILIDARKDNKPSASKA